MTDHTSSFFIDQKNEKILRAKIQSRHTSSKIYNLWIEFDIDSRNPINCWYCQCKADARTVGCCAHIASVLWYFGYYRYNVMNLRPCQKYDDFIEDALKADSDWSESQN